MSERCKICANEIPDTSLREHIVRKHGAHASSVEKAYPELYRELFVDDRLRERYRSPDQGVTGDSTPTRDDPGMGEIPGDSPAGSETPGPSTAGEEIGSGAGRVDRGTSKKWLLLGVGGAGNHILDAVLMRRDTLQMENSALAEVWERGIADYLNLNTNRAEVYDTYYAQVDKEYSPEALVTNCMIGHNRHSYSGAGRDWERGREFIEYDFEGETNAFNERWDVDRQSLRGAQAIMLVHSVTKGTGCGATPVLAENLREMLESSGPGSAGLAHKPILSSVVLPTQTDFGGSEMIRGVIGIARLSEAVDGIIPFDNAQLESIRSDLAVDINEEWLETYNPPKYTAVNRLLVSFLEGFTMSSTPITYDASATKQISGEMFDVPDSIRPAVQKYPVHDDLEYDPAVVMVPVMGRHDSPTDEHDLDTLVRSTLLQGQFIEFEPDTAWGGTFMLYGPEEKMDDLAPLLSENRLRELIGSDDFLAREAVDAGESVDIYVDQLVVPQVDSVHLWGLIWNPKLPTLERMYDHAEELVEHSTSRQAQALDEVWGNVEPVFGYLGRENMG